MPRQARQAFSIRLNTHERNRYQALAGAKGISLGEWAREAMMKLAEREECVEARSLEDSRGFGDDSYRME